MHLQPQKHLFPLAAVPLLLLFSVVVVLAQTTAFSYQGRLTDGGSPANGTYDLQFTLYNASSAAIGSPLVREDVVVTNGVFTVQLDFGASVFTNGQASTLEIGVRPGAATGAFTILSPRQPITATPYAIQTLNASQLGGIDASQYVTTTNGATNFIKNATTQQAGANFNISGNGTLSTLDVNGAAAPSAAPAGRGRIYFDFAANKFRASENGGAFIDLIGSGGVSGTGTTNTIPLWTGNTALGNSVLTQASGNIGIGVAAPQAKLDVNGTAQLAPGGSGGGKIFFGTPNAETGFSITGTNRADVRFDGATLKLLAGTGLTSPANGIAIDTAGNVGIGTFAPQNKLVVNAGGSGGAVNFGTPGGESGLSIIGSNRADVRFDGTTLKLLAGTGLGAMASTNGININGAGNVGIGTTSPGAKLEVVAGSSTAISATSQANAIVGLSSTPNFAAIYGENTSGAAGYGVYGKGTAGLAMYADGNAGQARDKGGWVKAMIYVKEDGTVFRCYNSQMPDGGASLPPSGTTGCGFSVDTPVPDIQTVNNPYLVTFPFQVGDRFVSVTPHLPIAGVNISAMISLSNQIIEVTIFTELGSTHSGHGPFTLIVY